MLVAAAWFWAANGSLTAVSVAFTWMVAISFWASSALPVLSVVPALILISFRLIPLFKSGLLKDTFDATAKAIGAKRNKAKYVEANSSNSFWNLAIRLFPMVFTLYLVALFSMKVETLVSPDMLLGFAFFVFP